MISHHNIVHLVGVNGIGRIGINLARDDSRVAQCDGANKAIRRIFFDNQISPAREIACTFGTHILHAIKIESGPRRTCRCGIMR